MKSEQDIRNLFSRLFRRTGRDPVEIIQIKPVDGQWGNALSYEIKRSDGLMTRVFRCDIDDANEQSILAALGSFRKAP